MSNLIDIDLGEDYYFDEDTAKGVVAFIEDNLTHIKGPDSGKPFILEEWQKRKIFYPLFGVKEKATGLRRFKYVYAEIPKKNGKSPLMSALVILMLKYIKDSGAELVSVASSRDQAKIVFGDAKKMIQANPKLNKDFMLFQNSVVMGNKSYKPLSADVGTNDGGNNNVVIIDELHRFKDRELVDLMEGSMAAKEEPIFFMITTAGSSFTSICWEKHEYAVKVRDGVIKDDRFLPVIYAADKNDDPFSEETWIKANPNYGVSVRKDFMKEQAEKARMSAAYRNNFLRLHLNIWTNVQDVWIPDQIFHRCAAKENRDWLFEKLKGSAAYCAMDLSSTTDLSSFTVMIRPDENRDIYPDKFISLNWYFLPEEKGQDSADRNNAVYLNWVAAGYIEETPGNVIDYDLIYARIMEVADNFNLVGLAFDPWNSHQIAAKLTDTLGEDRMFKHPQDFKAFTSPVQDFEVTIQKGEYVYDGNPVTRWCMSNTSLKFTSDGKACKPDKSKREQKIDGAVTNIMAYNAANKLKDRSGSYIVETGTITMLE